MKSASLLAAMTFVVLSQAADATPGLKKLDPKETRRALEFVGTCSVHREHDIARTYVLSAGDRKAVQFKRINQRECMPKSGMFIAMTTDTLLGSFAEALFKADRVSVSEGAFSGIAPLTYVEPTPLRTVDDKGKAVPEKGINSQKVAIALRHAMNTRLRLGECVVRRDPVRSDYVLRTAIDTDAELAAIKALTPAISECLPEGMTAGFDRTNLRGSVAVALYRLSQAPRSNGATQ